MPPATAHRLVVAPVAIAATAAPRTVVTVPARSFDATAISTTVNDGLVAALAVAAPRCERG